MGFSWSIPNSRKSSLPAHDALANFQNGLLPLLDVFHELDGGSVAFFDVIADVAIGFLVAIEHLAVLRIQPKLRNVLIVNADQVILAVFGNVNVRFHLARARTGIAQAGPRIQMLDDVDGDLDVLEGTVQQAGDFLELAQFHQFKMIWTTICQATPPFRRGFRVAAAGTPADRSRPRRPGPACGPRAGLP